ncbi:uncharacterized protein CELE_Y73F8A.25 [Caenorhabditis elegans]|uniref:Secreted protein n=1 Tax=Caenorhabditis elegans TaxID=6239 RepID=A0A078BPK7_CAEEL|nr:Secreted protein [Caenorhabditis elegans]CDX47475.1 Secreted protein [Caenorhabditis elegans]|eukprot:NP_001294108.1 NOT-Like (yeast CCR4/NOT complex component) [Caenorhabditis elegans]
MCLICSFVNSAAAPIIASGPSSNFSIISSKSDTHTVVQAFESSKDVKKGVFQRFFVPENAEKGENRKKIDKFDEK